MFLASKIKLFKLYIFKDPHEFNFRLRSAISKPLVVKKHIIDEKWAVVVLKFFPSLINVLVISV